MAHRVAVPLDEVVEARRCTQEALADVVNALRLRLRFDPAGRAAGRRHASGPAAALAHAILVGGPAVGGGPARAGDAQVMIQAGDALHHVQENVVTVAAEQLLDKRQVLTRLKQ